MKKFSFRKIKVFNIVRFILLCQLAFIIIFPILSQFSTSLMSKEDLYDKTVKYIPKMFNLDNYKFVIQFTDYYGGLLNTTLLSLMTAVLTVMSSALIGFGLAKIKFKLRNILFVIVILTIIIPPQTIMLSLFMKFRYFDFFGVFTALFGASAKFIDTLFPSFLLSATGFGFRGGLFIFLMLQFYRGVPDELIEAAHVDGANIYTVFFRIIFPLGRSVMITIALLSFSWQWTDVFYSNILFSNFNVLSKMVAKVTYIPASEIITGSAVSAQLINTATILILAPLLLLFIFSQKFMVEGIERSGLVG